MIMTAGWWCLGVGTVALIPLDAWQGLDNGKNKGKMTLHKELLKSGTNPPIYQIKVNS